MKNNIFHIFILNLSSFLISTLVTAQSTKTKNKYHQIQLGPRPYYLIDNMESSTLKESLKKCSKGPFKATDFSIGHRGAPLQFPEHTEESYRAAARMGAGILECDVTFTKDKKLVCRHSQCDLHTTTNILAIPQLASKCSEPFSPANPKRGKKASAKCCTSDITLSDFKKLCGKMDSFNPDALTVDEYLKGTEKWRTDLYSTCGKLLSHKESIELFSELGVKFTPELKEPAVSMPFQGSYSQKDYAKSMIDEYKAAKIDPNKVFPQSFNLEDVLYWISNEPDFGKQAVYLDSRVYTKGGYDNAVKNMSKLSSKGVKIIAPPIRPS